MECMLRCIQGLQREEVAEIVRKQISIEPRQERLLKRLAQETGVTEAEVVRQAIDCQVRLVCPLRDVRAWEEEQAFIDQSMQRGPVSR